MFCYRNLKNKSNSFFKEEDYGDKDPYNGMNLPSLCPTFVDIDNDGDQDVFLSFNHCYQNVGIPSKPMSIRNDKLDLEVLKGFVIKNFKVIFLDIDNDGDKDAWLFPKMVVRRFWKTMERIIFFSEKGKNPSIQDLINFHKICSDWIYIS